MFHPMQRDHLCANEHPAVWKALREIQRQLPCSV